ncbi:MAG: ABC transporter substrate-binding protein, partial [Marmoricola sp.]
MTFLRRLIGTALVALLVLASAACGALDEGGEGKDVVHAKGNATEVKVGYLHTIAVDDKLWLGQAEGQWADAGLDIKTTAFDTGIELSQALAGGSVDVAIMGGVTSNFPAQGQGKIFMLNSRETATARLFVQDGSGITTVSQLKGKKIITTEGTTADIYLHRALEKAGLDRTDVEVVNAKMPDAVQAFIGGKVPAVALWVPFDLRVNEAGKGAKEIDNAGNYADAGVGDGWIANNDWYDANQPTIKKIIGAWLKVNAAYRDDPDGSLAKVHELAYKDAAKLADLKHQVEFQKDYTNAEWLQAYQNGDVLKWVGDAEKAYVELGGVPKYVDPKEFFDTSLFIEVAKS